MRVIGCGAIAREILAVCALNGLDHIDLKCLPADWHLFPDRIAPGVRRAVREARRAGFQRIFVAYGDCGTGGMLDRVCEEEGVSRLPGPHCYAFYTGADVFARRENEIDAFYLTDFLVRQFDAFIVEPLGLDRHPALRDAYFGNYRTLVYLAQEADPALDRRARAAADRLGLAYEYRVTGYGDLVPALRSL